MGSFIHRGIWVFFALLFLVPPASLAKDGLVVAVVVNPANSTDALTLNEIAKQFKQEKKFWGSGKKIYLVLQESSRPEQELMLRKVYRMTERELKALWLGKMFQGEISSFPKTWLSNEAVKQVVSQVPNAIGFIDAAEVDNRVKVLRIEGKHPGDPGYVLSD